MARIRTIALTSQRANTPLSTKNGSLRSPTKTSKGARKSTNRTRPPPAPGRCANCKCDEESAKMWRFNGNQNRRLCSKCGIYERDHGGTPRPLTLDHPPPRTSPSISSSVSSEDDEDVRAAASALLGLGTFGANSTTRKTASTTRPKDRISSPASLPAFMCSPTIPSIVPPPGMYRLEHSPVRTPIVVEQSRKRPPPITIPSRSRSRSTSSSVLQTPPTEMSCAAPRSGKSKAEGATSPNEVAF